VLILPYLEQKALYDLYRFDEPWDGPNNRKLAEQMSRIYACPSDTNPSPTETSYVAVVGPRTAWPGEKSSKSRDITDGMSNTIMVVEVHHSGIHWMEPRDFSTTQIPMAINPERGSGVCSLHPNGAQAVFADGSVHFLTDEIPPETLRALLTANAGDDVSGEW
jgi:prepilin-type processing-associated H-X9-DG protein